MLFVVVATKMLSVQLLFSFWKWFIHCSIQICHDDKLNLLHSDSVKEEMCFLQSGATLAGRSAVNNSIKKDILFRNVWYKVRKMWLPSRCTSHSLSTQCIVHMFAVKCSVVRYCTDACSATKWG